MADKRRIKHVYNTELIKPKLWERIILGFVKLERSEDDKHVFFYKVFWNRLYLMSHICKTPKGPSTSQPAKGVMGWCHTPWLN